MTPLERAAEALRERYDQRGTFEEDAAAGLAAALSDEDEMVRRSAVAIAAVTGITPDDLDYDEACAVVADLRAYLLDVSAVGARSELPPPAPRAPTGDTTTRGEDAR